jgi:hypothetical protein
LACSISYQIRIGNTCIIADTNPEYGYGWSGGINFITAVRTYCAASESCSITGWVINGSTIKGKSICCDTDTSGIGLICKDRVIKN